MRMSQQGCSVRGMVTSRTSAALCWWRAGGHARQLTGGGDFGAFHGLGKHAQGRLTLSVMHLLVMQVTTCRIA